MPLDVLGRTRATLMKAARIPSKRESSARVDYVPALCTHRPSLLPIEWLSETLGLAVYSRQRRLLAEKLVKLGHLEENSVNHRIFERTLRSLVFRGACLSHDNLVSNQARKPAELKHINKRRKRN
ncbi:hypothetical protein BDK51DRAFT_35612 [Blyttiomyces helicus]|uniref:Uncharacterized protein n=1 Tax=Blyttiomyces helicus TaxID=388810 RepID=A0A4P9WDH0_9FUNG|nr:hypothetical protein BDK51DRAFT_35633 [Blyttiomyces helicus]RKO89713.1 hypothetical protein BDK51DRAFT_36170 [Blyttiomyces helicus]RKO90672.1 hypothetical protein BDK51DRAFT_35612 [Blyttiomyces helicus]|eukprot:RKO88845.1 hypothetical protein BDK51DRAFT_35633 [Blyttiomyces helicus]